MKYVFAYTVFLFWAASSNAQGDTRQEQLTTTTLPNNPWGLDKYIWSHTHPTPSKGDKPMLDFDAIDKCTELGLNLSISPNGLFFAYTIQNAITFEQHSLIIRSTKDAWRQEFTNTSPGFFTADSKQYIYQDKEALCFLQTGKEEIRKIKDILSFQQPVKNNGKWLACLLKNKEATLILLDLLTGTEKQFNQVSRYSFDQKGQWLACQLNNEAKELMVYQLATGKETRFPAVGGYLFDADGQAMLIKTMGNSADRSFTALQYVNLSDKAIHTLWQVTDSTTNMVSYALDGTGKQAVFVVQDKALSTGTSLQSDHSIWYWHTGMDKAIMKVNNHTAGIETGLFIEGSSAAFTNNNRYILFDVQPSVTDPGNPNPDAVKVDIWNYKDTIIQSTQPYLLHTPPQTYSAVISTEGHKGVIRLNKEHETLLNLQNDFVIVEKSIRHINGDRFWEKDYYKDSIWLVALTSGSRRFIGQMPEYDRHTRLSPGGKYLVYFDASRQCHYFSIDLNTGKLAPISAGIPAGQLGQVNAYKPYEKSIYSAGLICWLEGDAGLLVNDQYGDIWQLDIAGERPPLNITNAYGKAHHIQFKLLGYKSDISGIPTIKAQDTLILTAFNTINQYQGFYRKIVSQAGNPEQLYMGPYSLDITFNASDSKASDAHVWIVKKESATEAPNYFMTTDFKNFTPLTDLQPHKGYNWLIAELHAFKQPNGITSHGILYKPENFDPSKKYPVIIAFYASFSKELYKYKYPNYMWSPVAPGFNPGWMVSHGYLVFTPDIYFTDNRWGISALNTVEGAAKYVSSLPFVDSKRMGACGHSNSGRFGYYVLSHSTSFTAMSIGAGTTNITNIALALELPGTDEKSRLEWAEVGAFGGGLGNLWQNKATWLDHTSVLHADKVTSPLLIFHNKKDGVPLGEAVAMFTALRRLEKKVWWTQYNESGHTVGGKDGKDFTIRYTQFFDHYLKGAPAPHWMTQGIPYKLKGIENGFALDPEGTCGNDCQVCKNRKTNTK